MARQVPQILGTAARRTRDGAGSWEEEAMIDVSHQISAVERRVGSRVLDAGQARVVTITQTYDAEVEDVWDAVTDAERIPRWFLPVTGDLRLGGRYQFEGQAGGLIQRCDPPTAFDATWEYGGDVSWIEVRLSAVGGGTQLQLEHIAHVDDERWVEFGPGAVGVGWDLAIMGPAIDDSPPQHKRPLSQVAMHRNVSIGELAEGAQRSGRKLP